MHGPGARDNVPGSEYVMTLVSAEFYVLIWFEIASSQVWKNIPAAYLSESKNCLQGNCIDLRLYHMKSWFMRSWSMERFNSSILSSVIFPRYFYVRLERRYPSCSPITEKYPRVYLGATTFAMWLIRLEHSIPGTAIAVNFPRYH